MKPDFLGARGSNTGDDFHEWWALRSALRLINQDTELKAVTVEGVNIDDKKRQGLSEWDSVDCGLYYGGYTVETAEKVVIEQLKYSASSPNKSWTVSEISSSKSKTSNSSIIKGLAKTFCAIQKVRPDLISTKALDIKLVSNRPIGDDLKRSLGNDKSEKYEILRKASGLSKSYFKQFIQLFDFSNCGEGSRFEQEERAINEILDLTLSADRGFVLDLKDRIHKLMLPEGTGSCITRETVLTWMNVSDPRALFPCPSRLNIAEYLIDRNAAVALHQEIISGNQFLCLHGEGGSGKTTVLRQVEELLPNASAMIIYDCYGAGTYQDSDAYRHRPKDAYLQIINEISGLLRLPLLINQGSSIDLLKAFALKIESASSVLKAQSNDAVLVIVIDAADNSVTGADQCQPPEVSFIHELMKIGSLPSNVRLLVSSRTGRLDSLAIPEKYRKIEITNFSLEETTLNVRNQYPEVTDAWIEDFHTLSNQNPRVQSYAFDYGGLNSDRTIEYLRPNGKDLEQIFEARFKEAIIKEGSKETLALVCSAFIALPRPAPKKHLASILGISKERLNDIISDLPGMRIVGEAVGFLDEDIEFFIREKAQYRLSEVYQRAAAHFCAIHEEDEYAAKHLASILFSAGQGQKIIGIIEKDQAPVAIKDQIIRREVQRQRLQLAMKVCRAAGQSAEAILTLLVGAEAIKTDEAVDKIIIENPDLSTHFASDTVGRNILYSSKMYEHHGRFLSHIIARNVDEKDFIAARDKKRILREWMHRRSDDMERQRAEASQHAHQHIEPWPIEQEDIAAVAHGILDMQDFQAAYDYVCGWKPRRIHFEIALILIDRLLMSGRADTVNSILKSGCIPEPWSSLFSIPLATTGYAIDCVALETALTHKKVFKYFDLKALNMPMPEKSISTRYVEMIITGCEILAANGRSLSPVEPLLEQLCPGEWRNIHNIYPHDTWKNDIGFRAFSLLKCHRDEVAAIESYCIEPAISDNVEESEKRKQENRLRDKRKELEDGLSSLMRVYSVRASILMSRISLDDIEAKAKAALGSFSSNSWRLSTEHYFSAISDQLSLTIAQLAVVPNISMDTVFGLTKQSFKEWPEVFSSGQRRAIAFLLKIPSLRQQLTEDIYKRSTEVEKLKTAASEKIDILLELSRLLIFVDREEARAVFKIAVDIANDVDVDAMHEVSLFVAFSRNAKNYFSASESRQIAAQMAAITTEYGTLLAGYENFPWGDAVSAIATLDMPKAIRMIGYWEDSDLSSLDDTIPSLISSGIENGDIEPTQAVALLNFCNSLDSEFLISLILSKNTQANVQLVEEISRAELLRFNRLGRSKISGALNEIVPYDSDSRYWHSSLNKQVKFRAENKKQLNGKAKSDVYDSIERRLKEKEFIEAIPLETISFASASDFLESIRLKQTEAREKSIYISCDDIAKSVASRLPTKKRIVFLNLLIDEKVVDDFGYSWANLLLYCIDLWRASSYTVAAWKEENLPSLIIKHLGRFTYSEGYGYDKRMLIDLLDGLGLGQSATVDLLLSGLEVNADTLPLSKLYSVLGLLTDFCKPSEVADVATRYINRLVTRLKLPEDFDTSEGSVESSIALQLYSLLGDVDTRVRWRAAHSIRAFARMGHYQIINALTELYDNTGVQDCREEGIPFYWMSARLWLIVTFDRIASETPKAVVPAARWLLSIANDQDFPHVLMRYFAKSCLTKLISGQYLDFDLSEISKVETINTSDKPPKERVDQAPRTKFRKKQQERRFRFDELDTLSYVYPGAIESFAEVSQTMFLDEAEAWIIDRWKKGTGLSEWKNEPRKHRFERANYTLYSQGHGAMPTIERHRYYLEWHSMWCSMGSLMETHELSKPKYDDDDYGTFNGFLRRNGLTQAPHWASDLRCPTPLELRFQYPPKEEPEEWVNSIEANDFDIELGLSSDHGKLVVDSYHDIRTEKHRSTVRISSALVKPEVAIALMRALQTSNDSHDYRLPPSGNEFEIDDGVYELRGWISEYSNDARLDEKDTFNYGVRMIESMPSKHVIDELELSQSHGYPVSWCNCGTEIFAYETWGETKDDSRQKEYIYGGEVISDGHRLKISSDSLNEYLNNVDFDLIVEIEITRRASKDGIKNYDQESEKEARYARIYLLRRTGEIFTTEGCAGSWTSFSN